VTALHKALVILPYIRARNAESRILGQHLEALKQPRIIGPSLLPGKGLARYRAQGSARLQPLPIRTAREVFPQAAHPVSFVERVMGRLGHEGHFHENCSALGSGWIFQSQYRPSTSYKYSLLHRRHPMFRLRLSLYPSPQLLQTHGYLYHFTPGSP